MLHDVSHLNTCGIILYASLSISVSIFNLLDFVSSVVVQHVDDVMLIICLL